MLELTIASVLLSAMCVIIGFYQIKAFAEERKGWTFERESMLRKIMAKDYREYVLGEQMSVAKPLQPYLSDQDEARLARDMAKERAE